MKLDKSKVTEGKESERRHKNNKLNNFTTQVSYQSTDLEDHVFLVSSMPSGSYILYSSARFPESVGRDLMEISFLRLGAPRFPTLPL